MDTMGAMIAKVSRIKKNYVPFTGLRLFLDEIALRQAEIFLLVQNVRFILIWFLTTKAMNNISKHAPLSLKQNQRAYKNMHPV